MKKGSNTLAAEIVELEALLAQIPEENVLERFGFEQRLQLARESVNAVVALSEPERMQLTFRGEPVRGSNGIAAEFGSKASIFFTEAYTATIAGIKDRLKYMGPIPDKAKNQLLITGTAVGSFGFEFELPHLQSELFSESGGAEEAMATIVSLFKVSAESTEEAVTEVVSELHPRAIRKIASFLSYLSKNEAWCGLEFKDTAFRYRDIDQLRKSRDRLMKESVRETVEVYRGELQGVLPQGRTFEFKVGGEIGVIRGKVGASVEDPDILNRDWLHRFVEINLHVVQIGHGRPSFTLNELVDIKDA